MDHNCAHCSQGRWVVSRESAQSENLPEFLCTPAFLVLSVNFATEIKSFCIWGVDKLGTHNGKTDVDAKAPTRIKWGETKGASESSLLEISHLYVIAKVWKFYSWFISVNSFQRMFLWRIARLEIRPNCGSFLELGPSLPIVWWACDDWDIVCSLSCMISVFSVTSPRSGKFEFLVSSAFSDSIDIYCK